MNGWTNNSENSIRKYFTDAELRTHIGKYVLIKPIGEGGEGCVYLAKDCALNRFVAIKRVWNGSRAAEEQIKREALFLQNLRHPMLPIVYDLLWDGAWYLVMEYIEGISLHNYIEKNGMADEEQGRKWTEQLLDILQYLHTRRPPVIYQDLKPQNIMVCLNGSLRLVDFGAAFDRNYGGEGEHRKAVSIGYAAPEQMQRKGCTAYADERSDIYALGRIMYYIFTGADLARPPYTDLPITSYAPAINGDLEGVLRKCMEEKPAKRYQVVEEIRRDLGRKRRNKIAGVRRKQFVRMIEKKVFLTEKKSVGLSVL